MASHLDQSDLTFSGKQIESLKEAFFTAVFSKPQLNEIFNVITGIKAKQQIVIFGLLGLVGKKSGPNCAPEPSAETIPATEKWWDPEWIEDRFEECFKDLLKKFTAWGLKNGLDKADLTGTEFALFLEDRISDALAEAILRISMFAKKSAANVSGGGVIKNGVSVDFFNQIDGFWVQAFAIVAANSSQRIAIDRNGGASYAAQAFTQADIDNQVITGVLRAMIAAADERLTSDPGAQFWVTKSVADQYKAERLKAGANLEIGYTRTESGMQQFEFDGYQINVLSFQDRIIRAYMDNGTKWDLPHRIFFGVRDNHQLGVEEEGNLSELDPFYDKKSKTYVVDLGFSLDMKIVEDYKLIVAY
ncbi:hypothetical protein [Pedobacter sp. SYSU D00535]|uniref:hypothetical protein n=1 Tax=Pedobacter sp. SYSU D00535 TaxID=2810308 RepID=UPI001A97118E|nr:hypothetical protein [Pedobacter sp. SYSU D00535]